MALKPNSLACRFIPALTAGHVLLPSNRDGANNKLIEMRFEILQILVFSI